MEEDEVKSESVEKTEKEEEGTPKDMTSILQMLSEAMSQIESGLTAEK